MRRTLRPRPTRRSRSGRTAVRRRGTRCRGTGEMKPNPGGNEQLTVLAGVLLIVLLAVEGATLLNLRSLLTVHAFIGMFLLPIFALKMASPGSRMARDPTGSEAGL